MIAADHDLDALFKRLHLANARRVLAGPVDFWFAADILLSIRPLLSCTLLAHRVNPIGMTVALSAVTEMDNANPVPSPRRSETSRLAEDGLVLWRVTANDNNLWCLVFDLSGGFHLVIDADPFSDKPPTLVEHHDDIVAIVNRAAWWKATFLKWGWAEMDVE